MKVGRKYALQSEWRMVKHVRSMLSRMGVGHWDTLHDHRLMTTVVSSSMLMSHLACHINNLLDFVQEELKTAF